MRFPGCHPRSSRQSIDGVHLVDAVRGSHRELARVDLVCSESRVRAHVRRETSDRIAHGPQMVRGPPRVLRPLPATRDARMDQNVLRQRLHGRHGVLRSLGLHPDGDLFVQLVDPIRLRPQIVFRRTLRSRVSDIHPCPSLCVRRDRRGGRQPAPLAAQRLLAASVERPSPDRLWVQRPRLVDRSRVLSLCVFPTTYLSGLLGAESPPSTV